MMTAKARGKNRVVFFDDSDTERPAAGKSRGEDIRSIAHLKMLQSLAGKLNRSNDVREIGDVDRERAAPADRLPQLPRLHPRGPGAGCRSHSRASSTAPDRTAAQVFRTRVGEG